MEYPDTYFEDEVREGFYIPSLMKRAWAAQAEVLEIVEEICKKHHIRYFAEWGTLLGAVRHKGRIPWDDDIDICMLRQDYEKFCEVADEELPEECWFLDPYRTEGFKDMLGRILNSRVHVVEGEKLEKYHGFPYVAGIDIFWLDDLPDTEDVTNMYVWVNNHKYHLPKKCYETGVLLPFENREIPVPSDYEGILSRKYGDWKKIDRSGGLHGYPSYAKQQKFLEEEQAAQLFVYRYSEADREAVLSAREKKVTIQSRLDEFIPLFQEAHDEICRSVRQGDYTTAGQMLAECQDTAIQVGTTVEQEQGENHPVIRKLEQYCEVLFQLYSQMEEETFSDNTAFADVIKEKLSGMPELKIEEKKEVVFVPYKPSLWAGMEKEWQAATESENTDVYVVPAPYYYKDAYGRAKTEEPHYETGGYPEQVAITSYEDYNFQKHHPDVILIQCPYDEYNYGMTLHPFFYAKNLVKYTDKLVYIPALVMDEIGPGDERARENLKSYCNMPGVVYADTVLVQSEQMKNVYIELLTEFAGEDSRALWEKKIGTIASDTP